MKQLLFLIIPIFLISCSEEQKEPITDVEEYNHYLVSSNNESYKNAISEINFWSNRIKKDSSGVGELGPLAAAYTTLFETTGDVINLQKAELLYKKAIAISANNKDSYVRALGRNLISQHRFKEAKSILEESYQGVSNKRATEMVLFDVYMELGDYEKANECLTKVKNLKDYSYLIRLAKWNDHKGELEIAIKYMEKAKAIAESRNSTSLKIWTYTNLGDYYGHNGAIRKAYSYYLQTLKLQPDNVYAKVRIAWIAYAAEENISETQRILDSVMINYKGLDTYLFKAELADFSKNMNEAKRFKKLFIEKAENSRAVSMYNTDLIRLYAESNAKKALEIAQQEINNRATPNTYHNLAFVQLKNGKNKEALQTIESHVIGKTYEPIALYHTALIFKANELDDKVEALKKNLQNSAYELGPVLMRKIEEL